jgi:hypothetical protein
MWGIKMKPVLNPLVFSQVNLDSASLTMLTSTIHKVSEAGSYDGTIMRGSNIVSIFRLNAIDLSPTDCATEAKSQVNIDLKSLDSPVADHIESLSNNSFQVRTGGYAVFHVSGGAGGYSVELQKTGEQKKTKVFDSKKLGENDNFIATVLRPGTYNITDIDNKTKAELIVAYPEIGKIPKQPQPVKVECTPKAITPAKIKINPTEPLLFSFKTTSRIKIELTKPEDRPRKIEQPKTTKQTKAQPTPSNKNKPPIRHLRINV